MAYSYESLYNYIFFMQIDDLITIPKSLQSQVSQSIGGERTKGVMSRL